MLLRVNIIWIGIDDTDSVSGGCTTYVVYSLIQKLVEQGYDIIGYPRLVRLNPNIPWKTRGNGALALQIGRGAGKTIRIGSAYNQDLVACSTLKKDLSSSEYTAVKSLVQNLIERYAKTDDQNTNPGFVLLNKKPSQRLYTAAVQEIVHLTDVISLLKSHDALYKGYKNKRGLIGATAAIAWSPKSDTTFELITYREQDRWGTKRIVDNDSVKQMDKACTTTFDNYDYQNKHNRLVPHSPCPILYGIRGEHPKDLIHAKSMIISEQTIGFLFFETNQGTDDHLQKKTICDIQPYQSVIISGNVVSLPRTIPGGHVFFSIDDATGTIDCAAYEPTKQFRTVIRALNIGDRIDVYGGVREQPLTVNLEKINIRSLIQIREKTENPVCSRCGKHMKSRGTNQGYKCKRCGTTKKKPKTKQMKRSIKTGFYEVPVCARRHLSKPLKRM